MQPPSISQEKSIQVAWFRNVPWVDIALVVGTIILGIIALLVHLEVINPAFNLPTLSSHLLIKSICIAGAGVLAVAEIGKFIYNKCSITAELQVQQQDTNKTSEAEKTKIQNEIEKINIFETSVHHARYYEKDPMAKMTAYPITKRFTFGNSQSATLYGICPTSLDPSVEQKLIKALEIVSTPQEVLDALALFVTNPIYQDLDLAVKIGDSLIVVANKIISSEGSTYVKIKGTFRKIYSIEGSSKKILILAGSPTFNNIPLKPKGENFIDHATQLYQDLQDGKTPEICMIALNFCKKEV